MGDKRKVFINLCQSDAVPPPEPIEAEELMERLRNDTSHSYRIPMSISELRQHDIKGVSTTVCDVVIHPDFFTTIQNDELFSNFLVQVTIEAIDAKYNIQLDGGQCVFLKNRKQLGTLVKHRIRKQDIQTVYNSYTNPDPQTVSKLDELTNRFGSNKKCLIEELPNASDSITHWGTKIDNRIPHRLVLTFAEPQQLWAEFYLPQVLVESDIRLEVAEQQIRVYVPRYQQLLDEFLPKRIDDSRTTADWNSSKSVLLVKMPLLKSN